MKNWMITGVRTGLARAMAEAALARGDRVVGLLRGEGPAREFEELAPGRSIAAIADVTDRKAVFEAIEHAERVTGGIDILVNSAGNQLESYLEEAEPVEIRKIIESNLMGYLNTIQATLPYMRPRGKGHIINLSSLAGQVGVPWVGVYSISKFAIEGLSEVLEREVGALGIAVTVVEPGGFRSDFFARNHLREPSKIPDYERSAGPMRELLQERNEPGDPRKFAQVILKVVDAENPPLRIAVGDDAIQTVLAKAKLLEEQVEAWRDVCSNLNFDTEENSEVTAQFGSLMS